MALEEQQAAAEASTSSPAPALTNKERRLAKKAEKQAKQENKKGEKKASLKRKQEDEEDRVDDNSGNGDVALSGSNEDEGEEPKEGDAGEEEVEALSHKEMRKRRKLEKRGLLEPAEEKKAATANEADALPKRSPYSLWIGNLSFRTSPEKLQEWLEQGGIEGISRVHMPAGAKRGEFNKGFAYVDVPDVDTVKAGIGMSEGHLDGRRLLIKSGSDYSGRPEMNSNAVALATGKEEAGEGDAVAARQGKTGLTKTAQKILRAQKHPPGPTLFVGNLSFETKVDALREMIERSAHNRQEFAAKEKPGEGTKDGQEKAPRGAGIRKIRMGEFEDTGKCKGFAFIDFFTPAYATASLCDPHNARLLGRELKLEFAGADAIRRGAVKQPGDRPKGRPYERRTDNHRGEQPQEEGDEEMLKAEAPQPGTFDPDAPLPKKHKETKEEREARRAANPKTNRRIKPGAALANAQREKVSIDHRASMKAKKTFDDDD